MSNQQNNQGQDQQNKPAGQPDQSNDRNTTGQTGNTGNASPSDNDVRGQQQPGAQQENQGTEKPAETETGTEKPNVDPQQKPDTKY